MIEGEFSAMCIDKISAHVNGGRTEGLACADPVAMGKSYSNQVYNHTSTKRGIQEIISQAQTVNFNLAGTFARQS
jgi:hypothetical protein